MGLEHILQIDMAGLAGRLNVDNERNKQCTFQGDCANINGHIWRADYSYVVREYI